MDCKYGCGAVFEDTPEGRTAYMRHCQFDCPNKPDKKTAKPSDIFKKDSTEDEKKKHEKEEIGLTEEELLDEEQILGKIIAEASKTLKRPAIIRMVRYVLGKKEESIKVLAEALRLADIAPSQRNLILRNWAHHLEVEDVDHLLKKEKKEEISVEEEEGKEKKKPIEKLKDEVKRMYDDEFERLELLRVRKQIADLEKELSGEKKDEERKLIHIIDGVSLKVTPEEKRAWMRYEDERKKAEEEREERKEERKLRFEKAPKKEDELVEWVIGEGKEAKTIKVRPETIPILIQSQAQGKKEDDGSIKELRGEITRQNEKFQEFQMGILQKKIDDLEIQVSIDPIERLFQQKEKLEKLGFVSSGKISATDQMYAMDTKKLNTLLTIATDKSRSIEKKIDSLVNVFGPPAREFVREQILAMKKQRGASGEEVPRTEEEAEEALKSLEEIDQAMSGKEKTTESHVITVPKEKKTPPGKKE